MRRPLRSSTGIPVSSVKNRMLSAIETSRARQFERASGQLRKMGATSALYTAV